MDSVLKSLQANYPGVIQAISGQQPAVARQQAEIDAAVSPIYAQSQADMYKQFAPGMAQTGNEIERINQLASAGREAEIAGGIGGDLVGYADEFQRQLDPEFYAQREQIAAGQNKLLGSMDPTQLSGSERAEVERGIGRMGAVNPNATANTAANAMTFGTKLQEKQNNFSNVLAQASASLPAMRSGMTGFEVATRRALTPNQGQALFTGVQQNTGQNAWNTGNNFMNQATQLQGIKNQKSQSGFDRVMQGMSGVGNLFTFS